MTDKKQKELVTASVERLRNGSSSLTLEAAALTITYNELRTALKELLSNDGYTTLMAANHAAREMPRFGGVVGGRSAVSRPRPDDSKLPTVESMGKTEGWSWRRVPEHEQRPVKVDLGKEGTMTIMDAGDSLLIIIDPDGREFIKAGDYEKADLLRTCPNDEPPLRFVLYENSVTRKRLEKNTAYGEEQLERGKAAALARKAAKKNGNGPAPTLAEAAAAKKPRPVRTEGGRGNIRREPEPKAKKSTKSRKPTKSTSTRKTK